MSETSLKNEDLGYISFFEVGRQRLGFADFSVARVVAEHKGTYQVRNEKGEYTAKITGKQMFEASSREDYPAVGDWVAITELDNGQARIEGILPRKSIIKRQTGDKNSLGKKSEIQIIATNIDVAFIIQSVGRDYSLNRFERYFSILESEGIEPVIVLNKIDLINEEELQEKLTEIRERLGVVEVLTTSVKSKQGLDELKKYLKKGQTYCFLGSSGVGKSSLINELLEKEIVKVGEIGEYTNRGKHITTRREMYFLNSGGIVIDNPGVREVGITGFGEGVDVAFEEFVLLAQKCKYADCSHTHEPGCAVLAALEDGSLDQEKYSNYVNLKKEAKYFEMNRLEKKEKDRDFGKFLKKAKKDLRKYNLKEY